MNGNALAANGNAQLAHASQMALATQPAQYAHFQHPVPVPAMSNPTPLPFPQMQQSAGLGLQQLFSQLPYLSGLSALAQQPQAFPQLHVPPPVYPTIPPSPEHDAAVAACLREAQRTGTSLRLALEAFAQARGHAPVQWKDYFLDRHAAVTALLAPARTTSKPSFDSRAPATPTHTRTPEGRSTKRRRGDSDPDAFESDPERNEGCSEQESDGDASVFGYRARARARRQLDDDDDDDGSSADSYDDRRADASYAESAERPRASHAALTDRRRTHTSRPRQTSAPNGAPLAIAVLGCAVRTYADTPAMGASGGRVTAGDLDALAEWIVQQRWGADGASWVGFADKFPQRNAKAWAETYRRWKAEIDKRADVIRARRTEEAARILQGMQSDSRSGTELQAGGGEERREGGLASAPNVATLAQLDSVIVAETFVAIQSLQPPAQQQHAQTATASAEVREPENKIEPSDAHAVKRLATVRGGSPSHMLTITAHIAAEPRSRVHAVGAVSPLPLRARLSLADARYIVPSRTLEKPMLAPPYTRMSESGSPGQSARLPPVTIGHARLGPAVRGHGCTQREGH
ncbi:hypothetical protein K488DRAFT_86378 [Vararia minispora EC-137]|uniref:Uncharacterized protein n=1 Tax=Vararia minispora EC-137 TaxID=1314806 RepID=A0ACB8QKI5_9AGAM|nr:hypothetical protein K488DRAFT_86378 [Vararia minispora EC-137]